jgi:CheY-like chemotaxis protein
MSASEGVGGNRVDILIVDDTLGQRMAVESVLAELGENIVAVDSGREALRYLLDHDVAVICSTSTCRRWTASRRPP